MLTVLAQFVDNPHDVANEIHQSNVVAGWWTDKDTNQCIRLTRNRGQIMMLIVSELSEASEGLAGNLHDDKLPHLKMFDVELADAAIRLYDLIGCEEDLHGREALDVQDVLMQRAEVALGNVHAMQSNLMAVVNEISRAMEHDRKGRKPEMIRQLWTALQRIVVLCHVLQIDLFGIIAEKRAFNAQRPDHKLENRQKAGGKAY